MTGRLAYAGRRLLLTGPTLLVMSVFVFAIIHLSPGDPVISALGFNYTPAAAKALRHQMGLDQPIVTQYLNWMGSILHGNLGRDIVSHESLNHLIFSRFPVTLELTLLALGLSIVMGVTLGIRAAQRPGRLADRSLTALTVWGFSVPDFVLAILLILLFSVALSWLPPQDFVPLSQSPLENLQHMIMPVIALAIPETAYIAQTTRASMLETLNQDYVTFLRAKGIRENRIAFRHALRNAAIPVVSVIGLQFGALLGGAIVVENVFSLPGMGTMVVNAVSSRDYPVVQSGVLVIALMFIIVNLATDLLYVVLNPRLR
jgi:peptide/nickel transport system permease protein